MVIRDQIQEILRLLQHERDGGPYADDIVQVIWPPMIRVRRFYPLLLPANENGQPKSLCPKKHGYGMPYG